MEKDEQSKSVKRVSFEKKSEEMFEMWFDPRKKKKMSWEIEKKGTEEHGDLWERKRGKDRWKWGYCNKHLEKEW